MRQAALVADAASTDPDAEVRLLERSQTAPLGELRDECARTKANACDLEARRRRIRERRCLRIWVDGEGAGHLHLRDNLERVSTQRAGLGRRPIPRFDLLDRLCSHHHKLKTTEGWGLIEGRGKRAFVPPDDPRHP